MHCAYTKVNGGRKERIEKRMKKKKTFEFDAKRSK